MRASVTHLQPGADPMPAEIWPCPRHAHCALSSPKGTRWGPSEVQHWQSNTIAVHVLEKKTLRKDVDPVPHPPASLFSCSLLRQGSRSRCCFVSGSTARPRDPQVPAEYVEKQSREPPSPTSPSCLLLPLHLPHSGLLGRF